MDLNNIPKEAQALIAALLAAVTPTSTATAAPAAELSPEITAATKYRSKALRTTANSLAKAQLDVNADFDPEVMIQIVAGIAYRARDQYFWSRNQSEFQSRLLANEQDIGARVSDDVAGGGEHDDMPNPLANREQAVRYHNRNMEQYEVQLMMAEAMWLHYSRELMRNNVDVKYIPDFDIGERAFANYVDKRIAAARKNGATARDATRAAMQIERDTTFHFITPQVAEEPRASETDSAAA